MHAMIHDPLLCDKLIAERQELGVDRYDEVWEGMYVMNAMPNDEHQEFVKELTAIITAVVDWRGLGKNRPGVNISDREAWTSNYRVPDVAVFLNGTQATNYGTYWLGGPDFAVEIVSPFDGTLEKLPFYASVGTRELLLIDRDPWMLTLYELKNREMVERGCSTLQDGLVLASGVIPLSFRLLLDEGVPVVEVRHLPDDQRWIIRSQPTNPQP